MTAGRTRDRVHRLLVLAAGLAVGAVLLPPLPARAAPADSVTVTPRAESWYRPLPGLGSGLPNTCELPTGCAPAVPDPPVPPPHPYPPGTLHVGVGAGIEESRTYVALDLSDVPRDIEVTGGTLTMPIASDPTTGTKLPETARVRACHEPIFVPDGVDGDVTGAPVPDCTISSPATYVAASDEQPAALVVDLAPFVGQWSGRVAAVALLPEEGLPPTENWHVAFHRRDSDAADAMRIAATLELAAPDEEQPVPSTSVADDFTPPSAPDRFVVPPVDPRSFAAPPLAAPAPAQPARVQPTAVRPALPVLDGRFAYPVVFLLPLLVGAAIAWTGRAFTRDLLVAPIENGGTSWLRRVAHRD